MDHEKVEILAVWNHTAAHWKRGAAYIGAVAAFIVVVALARQIWFLAVFSAVFFGAILLLPVMLLRKQRSSPVLAALLERPDQVALVTHQLIPGRGMVSEKHSLRVKLADGTSIALQVPSPDVGRFVELLSRRSPAASFQTPWVRR